jgi:hypothetical protein
MSVIHPCGPAWATRNGEVLNAELSYRPDGKKARPRTWPHPEFDTALTAWFDACADGDRVEVFADIDISPAAASSKSGWPTRRSCPRTRRTRPG